MHSSGPATEATVTSPEPAISTSRPPRDVGHGGVARARDADLRLARRAGAGVARAGLAMRMRPSTLATVQSPQPALPSFRLAERPTEPQTAPPASTSTSRGRADHHLRHVAPGDVAHAADADARAFSPEPWQSRICRSRSPSTMVRPAEGADLQRQPRIGLAMTSTLMSLRFSGITVTRATASLTSTEAALAAPAASSRGRGGRQQAGEHHASWASCPPRCALSEALGRRSADRHVAAAGDGLGHLSRSPAFTRMSPRPEIEASRLSAAPPNSTAADARDRGLHAAGVAAGDLDVADAGDVGLQWRR